MQITIKHDDGTLEVVDNVINLKYHTEYSVRNEVDFMYKHSMFAPKYYIPGHPYPLEENVLKRVEESDTYVTEENLTEIIEEEFDFFESHVADLVEKGFKSEARFRSKAS